MDVRLTEDARRQLIDLDEPMLTRVNVILERLGDWPAVSGAKRLSGSLAGRFRIRTGHYRVQFYLSGNAVVVEKIGHRDGFYDD